MLSSLVVVLLLVVPTAILAKDVNTEYGTVRGHTVTVNLADGISQKNVTSYLGIPFATPPVGNLRFEPPLKAEAWSGVLEADTLKSVCMQTPIGVVTITHPRWTDFSEDCLNLNIYAPDDLSSGPLPVMVWFFGGGYVGGANIQYPGHFLATKDVVVVVPNYRLGVFGFVNTADGLLKGNMGLYDQLLALEFVRDNIANFGGDPNRVTIFGESAGSASTGLHMVSPLSKGLFHQGIEESGSESNLWSINAPGQNPENYVYQVAENANCTTDNTVDMVDCLRALSDRDLRRADDIQCTPGYICLGFGPVVDGPGGFIPDLPLTLRQNLGSDSVPLLSGICKDDGSLFNIAFIPEALQGGFNHSTFEYYLRERILAIYEPRLDEETFEDVIQAHNYLYTNWPYIEDLDANRHQVNMLLTDSSFGYPWDLQAKINSEFAPTYTYIMAFRSLNASSLIPEWMGVPHFGEVPFVWGYSNLLINPDVRNDSGIYFDLLGYTPEDITYADYVQTLWTNFAKYGNPTPTPVQDPFNQTAHTWPQFRVDDSLKVFYLDTEISTKERYRQLHYAFYSNYIPSVTNVPIYKSSSGSSVPFSASEFSDAMSNYLVELMTSSYPGEFENDFAALRDMF